MSDSEMTEAQIGQLLASYLEKLVSDEDKILFDEAVRCTGVSAFRAAYVLIWICCAESLKRKFRELSSRDDNARKVIRRIQDLEDRHSAIDKYVIDEAKKYGFITDSEATKLEHIYTMRCLYGHPYEEQPKPEELISAACTVTDAVLSKPTKLRKAYLSDQVTYLTAEKAFLDDLEQSVSNYAQEVHPKLSEDLHASFLEQLWKKAESIAGDPSAGIFFRRSVWFSIAYIKSDLENLIGELDVVNNLMRYPAVAAMVFSDPKIFSMISPQPQDIVIVKLIGYARKNSNCLKKLQELHASSSLSTRQLEKFSSFVKTLPLEYLSSSGVAPVFYIERIIEELKNHNWYVQDPAIDMIRSIGNEGISSLSEELQLALGNNVLQAAQGKSGSAMSFIEEISTSESLYPKRFIEGIVAECFVNDTNQIRFKECRMEAAVLCLKTVEPTPRKEIICRLVYRIRAGELKDSYGNYSRQKLDDEHKRVIKLLEEIRESDPENFKELLLLSESLLPLKCEEP